MKLINTTQGIDQNTYAPYIDVTVRLGVSEAEWYARCGTTDEDFSVTTLGTELRQCLQRAITKD